MRRAHARATAELASTARDAWWPPPGALLPASATARIFRRRPLARPSTPHLIARAHVTLSVGILGTGRVGTSVAISVLHAGFANEVLLADVRAEVAEGEAMDLAHGASFYPTAAVRAVPVDELLATDALVLAAGRGGAPGESRLDLLRDNARVLGELGERLGEYRGLVVVVSNPVDVLTSVVAERSGLPPERVIGTGTMLDTARLRQAVGEELRVDPHSVHAQVVGEHGDSEVVLWSSAHVGGRPLRQWPGWRQAQETEIA